MSGIELQPLIKDAGAELTQLAQGIGDDALTIVTPCDQYDVRGLLNHLLYWAPILEGAARKETVPNDRPAEPEQDLTMGDWRAVLAQQVDHIATAWADPAAWEGTTSLGALGEVPGSLVGSVVLMEFTIHGWDLAHATGQSFDCDDESAEAVLAYLKQTVDHGRTVGAFGPEVAVPPNASILHRTLGVSGRDPKWSPDTAN
jgi:uncharacterized protein (TIGR03086 family)